MKWYNIIFIDDEEFVIVSYDIPPVESLPSQDQCRGEDGDLDVVSICTCIVYR